MTIKVVLSGTAKRGASGRGVCPPLEAALETLGFEIGEFQNSQFLINLNHNKDSYKNFKPANNKIAKSFLIILEPFSVYPAQYSRKVQESYSHVFYPGRVTRGQESGEFLPWPYLFNENPALPRDREISVVDYIDKADKARTYSFQHWSARSHELTAIAANKVSPTSENLYGLRQRIVRDLPVSQLSLYGPLWNEPIAKQLKHRLSVGAYSLRTGFIPNPASILSGLLVNYPTARGTIDSKHRVLSDTKFSLVIENSIENITEKLFDSLINGSIPIYIGPNLASVGLPQGLAIEGLMTASSVIEAIGKISKEEISDRLDAIYEYIHSTNFLNVWNSDCVYERIAREIQNKVCCYI